MLTELLRNEFKPSRESIEGLQCEEASVIRTEMRRHTRWS